MVTECIYENFEDELVKLDFKKLIIKGSGSDSLLKPQSAERLMAKLPNASFKIIEGGGHELFSEKPAEILTEIEHFI
jgi:pimeloyl-ACP methyl ester carboxylesterase